MDRSTVIWVTASDMNRLRRLADYLVRFSRAAQAGVDTVEELLGEARIAHAEDIPFDVVTMNSIVSFEDVCHGKTRTVTIVYPDEAQAALGRISVLSPVGATLLGMREGDEARLPVPHARSPRVRICTVIREQQPRSEWTP